MGYICNFKNYGALNTYPYPSPPVIDMKLGISINTKEELIMFNKTESDVCSYSKCE